MNFKAKLSRVAIAVAVAAGLAGTATAQTTTSSIRGNVVTEAGSDLSGATVTIKHEPTGTSSVATTNENGTFSSRGLRVGGPYTITISGDGFVPAKVENVYLSLDQALDLPIQLESSRSTEVITVTGSTAGTGYTNEALSTSLGLQALQQVVSIDRDITDAAQLDPFASVNVQSGGSKELSIAGANNKFNSLTVDGVALNDRFGLNANGYPTQRSPISYDAIESLSIQTAPFDVEYNGFTGGTINAVTKSGTNEFHGSVGYYYTDDSFAGDNNGDEEFNLDFEEETFVATLGGPLIKDKLFFFVAYDKFESVAPLNRGPAGSGAVNEVPNITLDDVAQVSQIVSDVWGFDIGNFQKDDVQDEKVLANIDWNINDDHRAKFTYMLTDGNSINEQNGNNFLAQDEVLGASSAWYDRSEKVESFIAHVFSDWTSDFSTQFKVAKTTQATGQESLNGSEFPNFAVFLREVDGDENYLTIGPDRFRHGNSLDQDFFQVKLVGIYTTGDHIMKFGYEREEVDVNNLFAQNSEGSYLFNSLEDLANAEASALLYNNAITNDENDLRAIWGYNYNSLYFQDSWEATAELTIDAGIRYDWYEAEGSIRENQNFVDRYGYSNTNDVDGLDVILPRVSFQWYASDYTTVRGGIGRFSGGAPSVWVSNSYSNDGVISDNYQDFGSGQTYQVPTTPDAATGQYIPQNILDQLANIDPDGDVNALADDFDIPTTWKVSLGVAHEPEMEELEGWLFSADVLYNKLENATYWYDQRCENPVSTAPDGRGVYDCSEGPEAIVTSSIDEGDSILYALSASKAWDTSYGSFDFFTSYTYADVEDIGYGTSSTATSNYSDFAAYDRQQPQAGTSNFQTEHLWKMRFNWKKELIDGYETTVSIFAERRSGQPYSYTFDENNACVLDVGGGRCARESRNDDAGHLLYVPDGINDPLFAATSFGGDLAAQQEFIDYINSSELAQYKGGIAERNGDNSRWSTIIDVRVQQELPALYPEHKLTVFFDIENFGNLLNDDWGRIERTRYEYERAVVSANIVDGQYEYFDLNSDSRIKNLEVLDQSVWQVQFGIKYDF